MANENSLDQPEFDSSWPRYQLMVLQQLGDHTQVLQNLNTDMTEHKQAAAVHLAEFAMWKANVNETLADSQKIIDDILYDDKGLAKRISILEQQLNTESQLDLKSKHNWQFTSALIATISVVINVLIQLFVAFIKK